MTRVESEAFCKGGDYLASFHTYIMDRLGCRCRSAGCEGDKSRVIDCTAPSVVGLL